MTLDFAEQTSYQSYQHTAELTIGSHGFYGHTSYIAYYGQEQGEDRCIDSSRVCIPSCAHSCASIAEVHERTAQHCPVPVDWPRGHVYYLLWLLLFLLAKTTKHAPTAARRGFSMTMKASDGRKGCRPWIGTRCMLHGYSVKHTQAATQGLESDVAIDFVLSRRTRLENIVGFG